MPSDPMASPSPAAEKPKARGTALTILLGSAVAAAGLMASIPQDEGERLGAYRDIVGIWTICNGDTSGVQPGQVATKAECQERLERQLVAHASPVIACTPGLKGRDNQAWAAVSLAYNIGTGAYCRSTVARRFNAGDWRGGCDAFLMWNKAGGRVIRGLDDRRRRERAICMKGLT